jgi:hypothetical protein
MLKNYYFNGGLGAKITFKYYIEKYVFYIESERSCLLRRTPV